MCILGTSLMLVWLEALRLVLFPFLQQVSDHSKNEIPRMLLKMTNVQLYKYMDTQQACNC